jgi:GNAT superfamily N-acetyltransferase
VTVRAVRRGDLEQVIELDRQETGLEKREYWQRIYRRYGRPTRGEQSWFLVAVTGSVVVGFVIGEVRDWEFGSPPCAWLFAINIEASARQAGIASRLMNAFCDAVRGAGVRKVRTLLSRDKTLVLSFFRSQGMMAAPIIPLEIELQGAVQRGRG